MGGGGLECWRGYSKRDGERKTEKQLIRVILVFKRKREQREQYCREREGEMEEIESACRIIEPYMVTVKYEVI